MSFTRRTFVQTAGMSFLVNTTFANVFIRTATAEQEDAFGPDRVAAFANANVRTFQTLIGYDFSVSTNGRAFGTITLVSVDTHATTPQSSKSRLVGHVPRPSPQLLSGFTLRFTGYGKTLPQDTYTLYSPGIGSIPLLLVPASAKAANNTYFAVFNSLVSPARF